MVPVFVHESIPVHLTGQILQELAVHLPRFLELKSPIIAPTPPPIQIDLLHCQDVVLLFEELFNSGGLNQYEMLVMGRFSRYQIKQCSKDEK